MTCDVRHCVYEQCTRVSHVIRYSFERRVCRLRADRLFSTSVTSTPFSTFARVVVIPRQRRNVCLFSFRIFIIILRRSMNTRIFSISLDHRVSFDLRCVYKLDIYSTGCFSFLFRTVAVRVHRLVSNRTYGPCYVDDGFALVLSYIINNCIDIILSRDIFSHVHIYKQSQLFILLSLFVDKFSVRLSST